MIVVMQPMTIKSGGPMASRIVSPSRHAGILLIITVAEPVITTPGPCIGMSGNVLQLWISVPPAAAVEIAELIEARSAAFVASAAARAAGPPGVGAAATAAASAAVADARAVDCADWSPAAAASGSPRHAGRLPISTVGLPGDPARIPGMGCATASVTREPGPVGTIVTPRSDPRVYRRTAEARITVVQAIRETPCPSAQSSL